MKKNFSVNISGVLFNIDEDAFEALNRYFAGLKQHFNETEGKEEIIADIESRVAEMFQVKTAMGNNIVSLSDVEEMVKALGQPWEIGGEESHEPVYQEKKRPKRLYRDGEKRVIGGVSSGMAAYFNTDPVWFRLGFIASFFFIGPLLYFIFWIAIPKAKSRAEKLEMRGESVTIDSISKNRDWDSSPSNDRSELFKNFLGIIFKIIILFFGGIFVLTGIGLIISMIVMMFVPIPGMMQSGISAISITPWELKDFLFASEANFYLLNTGIFISILIPVIWVIFLGLRLIFNIKFMNKMLIMSSLGIWIAGIVMISIAGFRTAGDFSCKSATTETISWYCPSDTLSINLLQPSSLPDIGENHRKANIKVDNNTLMLAFAPYLEIKKHDKDSVEMVIIKSARGSNLDKAFSRAGSTAYSWVLHDSLLLLNPEYLIKREDGWRNQNVHIKLYVPARIQAIPDKSVSEVLMQKRNCPHHESACDEDFYLE